MLGTCQNNSLKTHVPSCTLTSCLWWEYIYSTIVLLRCSLLMSFQYSTVLLLLLYNHSHFFVTLYLQNIHTNIPLQAYILGLFENGISTSSQYDVLSACRSNIITNLHSWVCNTIWLHSQILGFKD